MTTKRLALSVLCILIAGCAGPTISSEYDPEALSNFGRYQTYAWQPNPDPRVGDNLVTFCLSVSARLGELN